MGVGGSRIAMAMFRSPLTFDFPNKTAFQFLAKEFLKCCSGSGIADFFAYFVAACMSDFFQTFLSVFFLIFLISYSLSLSLSLSQTVTPIARRRKAN